MDTSKQIEFTKEVREQDRDLKALAVRDIEKVSQQARDRFIERTKSMDSAQKYDAYSNCMMSTALLLVDRWGARFIPDICDALQLEQEELESTLNETDVLECIDLEGREAAELKEKPNYNPEELQAFVSYADFAAESLERVLEDLGTLQHRAIDGFDVSEGLAKLKERITAISDGDTAKIKELDAADDGTKSGTGAADPGTVSEIMKRLNRIEESLHSIGQQVEAIWLKTGAVELDAESIAEDLEETEPEQ